MWPYTSYFILFNILEFFQFKFTGFKKKQATPETKIQEASTHSSPAFDANQSHNEMDKN